MRMLLCDMVLRTLLCEDVAGPRTLLCEDVAAQYAAVRGCCCAIYGAADAAV